MNDVANKRYLEYQIGLQLQRKRHPQVTHTLTHLTTPRYHTTKPSRKKQKQKNKNTKNTKNNKNNKNNKNDKDKENNKNNKNSKNNKNNKNNSKQGHPRKHPMINSQ